MTDPRAELVARGYDAMIDTWEAWSAQIVDDSRHAWATDLASRLEDGARVLEEREAIAARLCRLQELAVVVEIEGAAHSTTTSRSRAASSARCSASTDVSAVAIT